jgi:Flp pilus assembly protein TadD
MPHIAIACIAVKKGRGRNFATLHSQTIFLAASMIALIAQKSIVAQSALATWNTPGYGWPADNSGYAQHDGRASFLFDKPFTVSQGKPTSSIVTLHELQHHVPGKATKEYERGLKAKDKGEDEAAVSYFRKAIAVDPEFCAAFNGLGTVYLRWNKLELAVEQFNNAIFVDPHAATPYSNLALAYIMQTYYADAERAARRAIDLNRTAAHGLLMLGVSLVLQGKFTPEADRALTRAADDFPQANVWRAVWLFGRGDIESAKDQLKAYIAHTGEAGADIATALLQRVESLAGDN